MLKPGEGRRGEIGPVCRRKGKEWQNDGEVKQE